MLARNKLLLLSVASSYVYAESLYDNNESPLTSVFGDTTQGNDKGMLNGMLGGGVKSVVNTGISAFSRKKTATNNGIKIVAGSIAVVVLAGGVNYLVIKIVLERSDGCYCLLGAEFEITQTEIPGLLPRILKVGYDRSFTIINLGAKAGCKYLAWNMLKDNFNENERKEIAKGAKNAVKLGAKKQKAQQGGNPANLNPMNPMNPMNLINSNNLIEEYGGIFAGLIPTPIAIGASLFKVGEQKDGKNKDFNKELMQFAIIDALVAGSFFNLREILQISDIALDLGGLNSLLVKCAIPGFTTLSFGATDVLVAFERTVAVSHSLRAVWKISQSSNILRAISDEVSMTPS